MNVHPYPGRAAAIAAAVLLAGTSTPAHAANTATASTASQQTVGSGSWGAVATLNTTAPYGTGPLTLTFTNTGTQGNPSFTSQYFTIGNTGTLPIITANYTGTASAPTTVQFTVESCSTTWNESADTCPGTTTRLLSPPPGSSSSTVTTTTVPPNPGSQILLRARVTTSGNVPKASTSTLTISTAVDRTQVRNATTTGG